MTRDVKMDNVHLYIKHLDVISRLLSLELCDATTIVSNQILTLSANTYFFVHWTSCQWVVRNRLTFAPIPVAETEICHSNAESFQNHMKQTCLQQIRDALHFLVRKPTGHWEVSLWSIRSKPSLHFHLQLFPHYLAVDEATPPEWA